MATETINGKDYPVYADVAFADEYLGGDVRRAPLWEALDADTQKRALVTSTRVLWAMRWVDGPPDIDAPPEVVQQAAALLAVDYGTTPAAASTSAGSNVKAVGAGSARVEFFEPTGARATALVPYDVLALLQGLLLASDASSSPALDGTAYGSSDCQVSRFDRSDYGFYGDGNRAVEPRELY